ncbi:MAG: hypothetical protein ACK5MR_14840 [Cumulibacter sp.]
MNKEILEIVIESLKEEIETCRTAGSKVLQIIYNVETEEERESAEKELKELNEMDDGYVTALRHFVKKYKQLIGEE